MTMKSVGKLSILAGLAVLTAVAFAGSKDVKISVDRALNSSTLSVRYSGASATLIEFRLNGESVGTRTTSPDKAIGETTFPINLAQLRDGDNVVEIRLFDRAGKIVGSQKTVIQTEQTSGAPVYLSSPKLGQALMGEVEIKVGMSTGMKSSYVSFFVDGNFKGMTNYPPFVYNWDTTKESNGWHEIEAWAIDESSNTYKTRKTRVFINNPGGRTDRIGVSGDLIPSNNAISGAIVGSVKGVKSILNGKTVASSLLPKVSTPKLINVTGPAFTAATLSTPSGTKAIGSSKVVAAGPKLMTPTGTRNNRIDLPMAPVAGNTRVTPQVASAVGAMKTALTLSIMKGTRLPNVGTYSVLFNNKVVKFDVAPRVEAGIPMTPFRHLFETAGGEVKWENLTKSVSAKADGKSIFVMIGDPNAKVNELSVTLEATPYLDRGRTIVPMSFLRDALNINIEYDKATNHVLITTVEKPKS